MRSHFVSGQRSPAAAEVNVGGTDCPPWVSRPVGREQRRSLAACVSRWQSSVGLSQLAAGIVPWALRVGTLCGQPESAGWSPEAGPLWWKTMWGVLIAPSDNETSGLGAATHLSRPRGTGCEHLRGQVNRQWKSGHGPCRWVCCAAGPETWTAVVCAA
ncbi:hypothetical protein NDU88_005794 [Pleurodeles waltl]|uniref:Uncharacterized protein n=1 Tax=Pleurodeles waltl TaxID=8319 RepID=A0AAV7NNJ1_PLEWA|nr:hypothetical protein NDU88_005794 [Pleurodeles waltl]